MSSGEEVVDSASDPLPPNSEGSWLEQCEDADVCNAMRCSFRHRSDKGIKLYSLGAWKDVSASKLMLGEMGFVSAGDALELSVKDHDEPNLRVTRRFWIAPELEADTLEELVLAMIGRGGGLANVVALAMGHHRVDGAFERAWRAAGCPAVELAGVELATSLSSTSEVPTEPSWRAHQAVRGFFSTVGKR